MYYCDYDSCYWKFIALTGGSWRRSLILIQDSSVNRNRLRDGDIQVPGLPGVYRVMALCSAGRASQMMSIAFELAQRLALRGKNPFDGHIGANMAPALRRLDGLLTDYRDVEAVESDRRNGGCAD